MVNRGGYVLREHMRRIGIIDLADLVLACHGQVDRGVKLLGDD